MFGRSMSFSFGAFLKNRAFTKSLFFSMSNDGIFHEEFTNHLDPLGIFRGAFARDLGVSSEFLGSEGRGR